MTHLCVPIFVSDIAQAQRDMALAAAGGADMVELRIDTFNEPQQIQTLVAKAPLPVILTCRPTWEGGRCQMVDAARLALLHEAAGKRVAYVDYEWKSLQRCPVAALPAKPTGLIVSSHDFSGQAARLLPIVEQISQSSGDVVKVVLTARTILDNLEAFEVLQKSVKPSIALCMGEAGLISRVLAKKFGAFLSFAALEADQGTAPGQLTLAEMKNLYRWEAIGAGTKVYGVVAHPVGHSLSPAIHNAAFAEVGYDGVYLPLLVNPGYESFQAFMESFVAFEGLDLAGLSVTLPHKENALRYLEECGGQIEELARSIGAVNTILIERSGGKIRLSGRNTDYAAILDCITGKLAISRAALAGMQVAVIGAGGVGRTATAALAHYGATVVVYNRTLGKAEALAREFSGHRGKVVAARLDKLCDSSCEVYIHCTSVGMHPKVEQSPLGEKLPKFTAGTLVFDTVYNPARTKLLRQAEESGARTIGGVEMFVRQAAAQFHAWTGKNAPLETMRRVVESKLGG